MSILGPGLPEPNKIGRAVENTALVVYLAARCVTLPFRYVGWLIRKKPQGERPEIMP